MKFEPVIKPANEGLVHHIILYACLGELGDHNDGRAWDCIWDVMPNQNKCFSAMFVWAIGGNVGESFYSMCQFNPKPFE